MQAHLYPTRHTIPFLLLLVISSLPILGIGCSSSDSSEYRQFSEKDKVEKSDQETAETAVTDDSKAPSTKQQAEQTKPEEKKQTAATPQPDTTKVASKKTEAAPTKTKSTLKSESTKRTENDVVALVARRPDPKLRALTPEEEKDLKASKPREVKILIKNHAFSKTSPGNALRVTYDDIDLLKVMNMEPVTPNAPELMPQWLKDLDGKRIRIRGFMYPPFQQTGNEFFMLARDNQICCFGKNPKIYDLFPVVMRDGVTSDYILNRPFDVVGTFHIKAETIGGEPDGELERIYLIDDAIVIDK